MDRAWGCASDNYRRIIIKKLFSDRDKTKCTDDGANNEDTHQSFSRQHLQEFQQVLAVPHVHIEIPDAAAHTHQVRVDPFLEGLLLHALTLVWK